jgi:hypothetical protein
MEATSRFFKEREMDHILWITVKDPPREEMGLVCVATGQGPVDVQETRLYLHKAIAGALAGGPWQEDPILQLDVVQSDEAEFQRAREVAGDDHGDVAGPPRAVADNAAATPMSAHRRILAFRSPTDQSTQELVRATEEQTLQLVDQLLSVKNGILDASRIHEIAIDSLTVLGGLAVPLLRELSGIQFAFEPSAETETVTRTKAMEQQLDPKTPSTAATLSKGSISSDRAANFRTKCSTPSSLMPSSESSRRSNDSNGKVLEWSGLTQIGSIGSQASGRTKRARD